MLTFSPESFHFTLYIRVYGRQIDVSTCSFLTIDASFRLTATADLLLLAISFLLALNDIYERRLPNDLLLCFLLIVLPDRLLAGMAWRDGLPAMLLVCVLYVLSAAGYHRGRILLGMGDVKLIALLYLWIGAAVIFVLWAASLAAALIMLVRKAASRPAGESICLAPFLILGAALFIFSARTGLL